MSLFYAPYVLFDSRLCPHIKFPSSTWTNKLACSQVSSKANKLVGSQVYSKVLFRVKYKVIVYLYCVKRRRFHNEFITSK